MSFGTLGCSDCRSQAGLGALPAAIATAVSVAQQGGSLLSTVKGWFSKKKTYERCPDQPPNEMVEIAWMAATESARQVMRQHWAKTHSDGRTFPPDVQDWAEWAREAGSGGNDCVPNTSAGKAQAAAFKQFMQQFSGYTMGSSVVNESVLQEALRRIKEAVVETVVERAGQEPAVREATERIVDRRVQAFGASYGIPLAAAGIGFGLFMMARSGRRRR